MLIIRFLLIAMALLLAVSAVLYFFTGDRRYMDFVWKTLRLTVLMLLVFALLYVLEHFVLVGWRILV